MALSALGNIFKVPDLKRRVLFTLGLLVVLQIGNNITVPGVNRIALESYYAHRAGAGGMDLFALIDQFSGGAFTRFSIFALGVMPYITASIIFQLLTVVWPYLEQLSKEGEEGRKKITQWTRYATVGLCLVQSGMYSSGYYGLVAPSGLPVVYLNRFAFQIVAMISITAGTVFVMWLGEQITERGIGNGISLIIFANIISRFPSTALQVGALVHQQLLTPFHVIIILAIMVCVVGLIVILQYGQRRITIKRGKQVVGRKTYSANVSYLPIRINTGGVIPVIFASSLLVFPTMITGLLQGMVDEDGMMFMVLARINDWLYPGGPLYVIASFALIIFFCYFYAALTFNPRDVAENLQKYGTTIPGYSHGKRTEEYIDRILTRVTLAGALLLAFVAVLPQVVVRNLGTETQLPWSVTDFLGGTSLIIVVGVALDTVNQIENHLIVRNYDGFRKRGRVKARRF